MLLLFEPPDYRRYDWDGIVSRLKAYQDGMAHGLGIDDYQIWMAHPARLEPSGDGQGRVIALLWRVADSPFVGIVRQYADSYGGRLEFGASKARRR